MDSCHLGAKTINIDENTQSNEKFTFKVTIIERNTDTVESERLEKLGIFVLEKVFKELWR